MSLPEDEGTSMPRGPVALRLGDLEQEVQSRRRADVAPGALVKRDLGRYYGLIRESEKALTFSLPEAEAIVLALGASFDVAAAPYIWAEVEQQYRNKANQDPNLGDSWPYLPDDFDPVQLIRRLSRLTRCECLVVADKVERYWVFHERTQPELFPEAFPKYLVAVGLCSDEAVELTHTKREREKRGLFVRDSLRDLRDSEAQEDR